jgi:hypothetical protein
MHWTTGDRKNSKWIIINPASEAFAPQHGKGNFAVKSQTAWRSLAAVSSGLIIKLIRQTEFAPRAKHTTAGTVARPGGILGDGSISLSPAAPQ